MSWPNRFPRSSILLAVLGFAAQVPASAQSAQMDAARAACSADLQQFCAGVQAGGGRMLACLKEHRDQVSPACTQAVKSVLQGSAGGAAAPAGQPTSGEAPTSGSTPLASPTAGALQAPAAAAASSAAGKRPSSTSATKPPIAHTSGGAAHYFELKRFTTTTKMSTTASEADVREFKVYSLLAPTDWNLVGGASLNPDTGSCFSDSIRVSGVVKTSDGAYGMALLPQSTFRYVDDPAIRQQWEQRARFDEKYKLKGCPILAPMRAADFIRENVVWKIHKDRPQVTSEPFPELEQLVRAELGLGPQSGGAGAGATRVEAARVRTSTTSPKGDPVDEWWSAVIVVRTVPLGGRGASYDWHAEQVTEFQAPSGKLDGYDKLYRVMATSIRPDPQFQSATTTMINNVYAAWAQEMRKQDAIIAAFQQQVIATLQGVTANQQHGSMVAAYGADQLVRGVQTFRDPSTGRTVELSNLYDHAWANGNDRYIVTDDPNFNPNGHINGGWGELQLVRPQP